LTSPPTKSRCWPSSTAREIARTHEEANVKTSKGEIGRVRIVGDFLPSPDRLALREENVKVTLSLSQRSVAFFKRAARQRRVPYQRMIRALVDTYAEKQEGKREAIRRGRNGSRGC
jgi:hypothetical protein